MSKKAKKTPTQTGQVWCSDTMAIEEIFALLANTKEWDSETMSAIYQVVCCTGRSVKETES